ncbi:MAG: LPS-assembly protein LptD [Terriglobales bacterium]
MIVRTRILITVAALCHLLLAAPILTSQLQPETPTPARTSPPQPGEPVTIRAQQQEKIGDFYRLRGEVEIEFRDYVLRADEITYNDATGEIVATGNIVFDGGPHDEHLTAKRATYNINTDSGQFFDVVGTTGAKMRGRNIILTSSNPFSFQGAVVDKVGRDKIVVHHGTATSCTLPNPKWAFRATRISVVAGEDAKIYNSSFWLWRLPVFYFPFFDHPVERLGRKTGILLPTIGQSSVKGTILGDSFFWAINRSMDATVGAEWYSKRGSAQHGEFRARPNEGSYMNARYFGVVDRGIARNVTISGPGGTLIVLPGKQDQGGHEVTLVGQLRFRDGLRAVADIDYLSTFVFRAAFSESFTQAINSEVRSTAFLTDVWRGFSFSGMASRYQNFQSIAHGDVITIVHAPQFQASTVDRRVEKTPLYWSFNAAADGLSRREPNFVTSNVVGRFDIYPRVLAPLLWRGWTLVPEFAVRNTWYSDRLIASAPVGTPIGRAVNRRALEATFDLRPPTLGRIFERTTFSRQWKHTIEPRFTYRYATGVENFASILRFDERDILSNTNEIEYGLINRLFGKKLGAECQQAAETEDTRRGCAASEFLSWEIAQKYFIDPTFGGALVAGRRNVFTTTVNFTGIAFLTEARNFSPIISRLRMRGPGTDVEWQLDYDTKKGRINASTAFVTYHLFGDVNVGGAHAYLQTPGEIVAGTQTLPSPSKFNQFRILASYGHPNKRGFAAAATVGADANLGFLQYSAVQTTYNWDCCGVTFEYRRFALGPVRNENQFRFALSLANVGTFGTLKRQERLF